MISHFINRRDGFVYLLVEGQPSLEEYQVAWEQLASDPDYRADLNWICDLLKANLNQILLLELLKFARFAESAGLADKSVALIAPLEHEEGVRHFAASHLDIGALEVFVDQTSAYNTLVTGQAERVALLSH